MLYRLSRLLDNFWGPFRLLSSHLVLLALGTMLAALLTWWFLPHLWRKLPTDRGKKIAADGGIVSRGKPTGAGLFISLLLLPVIFLCVPLSGWEWGVVASLYAAMWFGFADDASAVPWGELRKGLLDLLVALTASGCIYLAQGGAIWLPCTKIVFSVSAWLYIPGATFLLWLMMNATNCSDGVDGLAGSLTLVSLFSLSVLLYGVIGYIPISKYLLIPLNPAGARWAIFFMSAAGAVAGYLWHNAEPSKVLMGDAGSRFFGMMVGVAVLITGNPVFLIVTAPVVLVNGGSGMVKLIFLRVFRRLGFDVRMTTSLSPEDAKKQLVLIKMLHSVRFPLHDHFRKRKGWSNAQVLMRFMLIQSFLLPLLFLFCIKVR